MPKAGTATGTTRSLGDHVVNITLPDLRKPNVDPVSRGSESVSDSSAPAESPEIRVARIAYEEASAREADGVALLERRTRQSTRAERDYRDSVTALKKARSKRDDAKGPA